MRMHNHRNPKRILTVILIVGMFLLGEGISPRASQTEKVYGQTIHPCLNRVNVPKSEMHWLYVPQSADALYTEEHLFFLAGQLIKSKVVDASICPSDGLIKNGYANACGMATALPTVIIIQNMVNAPILQAWREVSVPPVLLKQLIRRESQFWPSLHNEDAGYFLYEFGFGHITNMGMQNALQWNRDLRAKACTVSNTGTCGETDESKAYLLLSSLVATCEKCANGVDSYSVNRSVDILAEVVMGHCYQTAQIVSNVTDWPAGLVVDYPTIWKLTLMNYTSGPGCVFDTISSTFEVTEGPMDWYEISANVSGRNCTYGLTYANNITAKYFDFPPK